MTENSTSFPQSRANLLGTSPAVHEGTKVSEATRTRPVPLNPKEVPPKMTQLDLWTECNHPRLWPDSEWSWVFPLAVKALASWASIGSNPIVTTHPNLTVTNRVYSDLKSELPGIQIVGGYQTNPFLSRRIDNVEGWEMLARTTRQIVELTGRQDCVINNELAWHDAFTTDQEIDWYRVEKGLSNLPKDVRYTFYPSLVARPDLPNYERQATIQMRFLQMVADQLPQLRWVTFDHSGPEASVYGPSVERHERMIKEFPDHETYPIAWMQDNPRYYWTIDEIIQIRDLCPAPSCAVYPNEFELVRDGIFCTRRIRENLEGLVLDLDSSVTRIRVGLRGLIDQLRIKADTIEEWSREVK